MVKNLPVMQETLGWIHGSGRFPWRREWLLTPLCLENSMNRGLWWATVHRVKRVWHDWESNTTYIHIVPIMVPNRYYTYGRCWINLFIFIFSPSRICYLWDMRNRLRQMPFCWFFSKSICHLQGRGWLSLVAQMVKNLTAMQENRVWALGWEDPPEEKTHSDILAWKTLWTEEAGGIQSMGSQRVGHDWATNTQRRGCFLNRAGDLWSGEHSKTSPSLVSLVSRKLGVQMTDVHQTFASILQRLVFTTTHGKPAPSQPQALLAVGEITRDFCWDSESRLFLGHYLK